MTLGASSDPGAAIARGHGAIVLAGGASQRMGAAKAALDWDGRPLLDHVAGVLARAVDGPVIVSAAPGVALPPMPSLRNGRGLRVDDPVADRGPLVGVVAAFEALEAVADPPGIVFVAAVDLPLLSVELVRRIVSLLEAAPDADVALPFVEGRGQPLAAAWRTRVLDEARRRVDAGQGGFQGLLGAVRVLELDPVLLLADRSLRAVDPRLDGLRDVDDPAALAALRATHGT